MVLVLGLGLVPVLCTCWCWFRGVSRVESSQERNRIDTNKTMNHHENNEHRRQEDELLQQQQLQAEHLLSPEGQKVLSILGSRSKSELPPFINGQINQAVNSIANEFLSKVRTAVQKLIMIGNVAEAEREERERGLTKTIVDEDWYDDERKIAKAIRYFPDVLSEKKFGMYPIMWAGRRQGGNMAYNLKNLSRIPLLAELGSELGQFDEELREGLLSTYADEEWNVLHFIICYDRIENGTTDLVDECFSAVWKRLRQNNHLKKEDINECNLVGRLLMANIGIFSGTRLLYFVDWDPMTLTIPCEPEHGNMLPIHWTAPEEISDIQDSIKGWIMMFSSFEKVMNEVLDCIANYFAASASSSTTESSLLMSAVTDETIHLEGLYTLLCKDPNDALLQLPKHLLQEDGRTDDNGGIKAGTSITMLTSLSTSTSTDTVSSTSINTKNDNCTQSSSDKK
ncbi:hypothetical protein FRACYDRAFT_254216 [Fragilariopsis cylindrus CCMP1102]|uniref:Uncharacterized protein n=1 Tax=Fragilariopsis cylindrus CCMP1102 TaxID=635003 RepID=A0A1E7EL72_9STRA|nr:hypothetical protein FRACYDRAFT_254216 [Fragilariopsis cylindrus CCMP1102]|eukprot:OEU06662.1 hypothetical protein FRACYDRAFT_254216 [Fragilariopsis cylindrus CCMP1102]